ncbi:hypothetical protein [Paenibacillus contaminans]|uniref:hypothetical protein n=1 Tax=Paenibacillus contaminans TaxID=450362 RepID=UPI0011BEFF57|nr:hypothetical protein [Paenibacillus contaminans]
MGVVLVNKLSIVFFIACIFLAGCTNKDEGKPSLPPTISSQPTVNLDTFNQPLTENVTILPQKAKNRGLDSFDNLKIKQVQYANLYT